MICIGDNNDVYRVLYPPAVYGKYLWKPPSLFPLHVATLSCSLYMFLLYLARLLYRCEELTLFASSLLCFPSFTAWWTDVIKERISDSNHAQLSRSLRRILPPGPNPLSFLLCYSFNCLSLCCQFPLTRRSLNGHPSHSTNPSFFFSSWWSIADCFAEYWAVLKNVLVNI